MEIIQITINTEVKFPTIPLEHEGYFPLSLSLSKSNLHSDLRSEWKGVEGRRKTQAERQLERR